MPDARDSEVCGTREAVCFDRRDCAGPVRRAIIVCIDFLVAIVLSFAVLFVLFFLQRREDDLPPEGLWLVPVLLYAYFTLVKRSRIRTLGYILTDVRVVDIRGGRPSLLQMTIRLLPLFPLPWSLLLDLGWMADEPQKQTLRDKWAGTYVVRRKARPNGTAPIRYKRIGLAGMLLIVPEIGRSRAATRDPAEGPTEVRTEPRPIA